MLIGEFAISTLMRKARDEEDSRSSYWEEQVSRIHIDAETILLGGGALGNFSTRKNYIHSIGHWLLQYPFRWMARKYPDFAKYHRMGQIIAQRQGRAFTLDMLRQVLTLSCIQRHVVNIDVKTANMVIGDGYGVMASLLLLARPAQKVILVNLTLPLIADLSAIRRAVPEAEIALVESPSEMNEAFASSDIRVIALRADNAELAVGVPVGLGINVVSMQEMDLPVIAEYFRILRSNPASETNFYCCNKLSKKLPDGTLVRFDFYPWRETDMIYVDEKCRWNHLYYTKRPPFWHYRHGKERVIWHRLARLEKR